LVVVCLIGIAKVQEEPIPELPLIPEPPPTQEPPPYCEHPNPEPGPPPVPAVYIPDEYKYVRRGDNFIPVFAQIAVPEAGTDNDWCPLCFTILYDGWYVVRWDDHGAGGEFGYFDEEGRWIPHNGDKTTHYRTAYWDKESGRYVPIEAKVVRISVEVDDYALYADDKEQSSSTYGYDGYFTVWEFWITPCPYNWRPMPNTTGPSFTAWIEPEVDHLGQSMGRFIAFELFSSTEPGECLNSHFLCPYDVDGVFDGIELHDIHDDDADLQFPPYLEGMYVYGQWEEDEEGPYVHNFTFAVTQQPTTIATVGTIFCFDGGAYGVLLAYTNMPEGIVFARRTETGLIEPVEIPYDKNGNFIADVWEWNMGIYPADALGDFDNYPVGDGTPGDGLSVYEEYRGLMVRYLWTVFNPWIKDMFVMNFGAGNENPYQPAVIPNDAITDAKGFPGAGMPLLWLMNANEGKTVTQTVTYGDHEGNSYKVLLTGKQVNHLHGYAHLQDVYAAVVVPGTQLLGNDSLAEIDGLPVIEANVEAIKKTAQRWGLNEWVGLTRVIGHELGHTVLWHVDHNPADCSQAFGGGGGHHVLGQDGRVGQHTIHCLMWPYFPPRICPSGFALCSPQTRFCPQWENHWVYDQTQKEWLPNLSAGWGVFAPTEFCATNPDCQHRWRLKP
jgi:hypothetical protein